MFEGRQEGERGRRRVGGKKGGGREGEGRMPKSGGQERCTIACNSVCNGEWAPVATPWNHYMTSKNFQHVYRLQAIIAESPYIEGVDCLQNDTNHPQNDPNCFQHDVIHLQKDPNHFQNDINRSQNDTDNMM